MCLLGVTRTISVLCAAICCCFCLVLLLVLLVSHALPLWEAWQAKAPWVKEQVRTLNSESWDWNSWQSWEQGAHWDESWWNQSWWSKTESWDWKQDAGWEQSDHVQGCGVQEARWEAKPELPEDSWQDETWQGMDLASDDPKTVLKNFLTRYFGKEPTRLKDWEYSSTQGEELLWSSVLRVPCWNDTVYRSRDLWEKQRDAEREVARQFLNEPEVRIAAKKLPPPRKWTRHFAPNKRQKSMRW